LGQNYLIDANILDIIADAAEISQGDGVLEIGPGLGALTERILSRGGRLTCIEADPTMAAYLRSRFGESIRLIEADALQVDLDGLFAEGIVRVAANLPYGVASRLMVDMAECEHRPVQMSLTIQKEVADRLTAAPGSGHYGVLGVLVGAFYRAELVKRISPNCFLPPPKVWSAVVCLKRRDEPIVSAACYPVFKTLVKRCFSQRRKQMGTILRRLGISPVEQLLADAGIDATARPERVSLAQWSALATLLQ
jgi:16S rRNA (adenine1518-N6/adenine1519-N6)-dimethyltransferase